MLNGFKEFIEKHRLGVIGFISSILILFVIGLTLKRFLYDFDPTLIFVGLILMVFVVAVAWILLFVFSEYKSEIIFLTISLVIAIIVSVVMAQVGVILGINAAIFNVNKASIENSYRSGYAAMLAEMRENQKIVSSTEQYVKEINPSTDTRAVQKNLEAASAMKQLSTSAFEEYKVFYWQVQVPMRFPPLRSASTSQEDFYIANAVYKQYDLLNQEIRSIQSAVIASIGFKGENFFNFISKLKQEMINQISDLKEVQIGNTPFNVEIGPWTTTPWLPVGTIPTSTGN